MCSYDRILEHKYIRDIFFDYQTINRFYYEILLCQRQISLTGAMRVSLGAGAAGTFTNSNSLWNTLSEVAINLFSNTSMYRSISNAVNKSIC